MIERENLCTDISDRVRGDATWSLHLIEVRDGNEIRIKPEDIKQVMFRMNGSAIEKMYLYNAMFRYANLALKGTEYEAIPWEYFREHQLALSDDAYIKRKDEKNYVYMLIDYFYHT